MRMDLFPVQADAIFSPWDMAGAMLRELWPGLLIIAAVVVTAVIIRKRRK